MDQASLSAPELGGMWGRGSKGRSQTLLQKTSDFLAERQWLLSLLTASGNMPVQAEAGGVSHLGSRLGSRGQAAQMCTQKRGLSVQPRGAAGHLTPRRSQSLFLPRMQNQD